MNEVLAQELLRALELQEIAVHSLLLRGAGDYAPGAVADQLDEYVDHLMEETGRQLTDRSGRMYVDLLMAFSLTAESLRSSVHGAFEIADRHAAAAAECLSRVKMDLLLSERRPGDEVWD